MIVYGICAGPGGKVDRIVRPSIEASDPDAVVLVREGQRSIFAAYESIRQEAAQIDGLDGLVLLHDDVELRASIVDPLRACFTDSTVGLVGAIGGRGQDFEWWGTPDRYGYAADLDRVSDYGGGTHDVDGVDGLLLALSPWAVRHLRIDGRVYPPFHGYDACISEQVRRAGKRVLVTDLPLMHHSETSVNTDWAAFEQARYAHYLRWRAAGPLRRAKWHRYRLQLRAKSLLGRAADR
ncbi:MAG: hypothetical protein QOC66_1141 [Pseudonocardiales bacterium]|nr:hypothetical protein [Pseudonocardiales bacterium]